MSAVLFRRQHWVRTLCVALTVTSLGSAWAARCTEDLAGEKPSAKGASRALPAPTVKVEPESALEPMLQLRMVAKEAARRSAALGAARLLAEAAESDLTVTKAGLYPQVLLNGGLSRSSQAVSGQTSGQSQASLGINVTASLYDGGRLRNMLQYQSGITDSAKLGAFITQEQVILEAVSAALERNRYRLQAQVFQQYMRKMGCLVEALESIVAEDRGRASELVQVRKTQAQTELQRDQALAQSRQSELRLRKLIGEAQFPSDGISVPLATVPDLGEVNRLSERSNEVLQLKAQIDAAEGYAGSIAAGQRPQVNWNVGKTELRQGGTPVSSWQAGVSVSYSLFNGFSDGAATQAAARRTQAARAQLDELLSTRATMTTQTWDNATSAFDRARRYVDVLRDSERVRQSTIQQWAQIGKRSLFDVMSAESDHFNLRIAYVNALYDGYQASAQLRSMGGGLGNWLVTE